MKFKICFADNTSKVLRTGDLVSTNLFGSEGWWELRKFDPYGYFTLTKGKDTIYMPPYHKFAGYVPSKPKKTTMGAVREAYSVKQNAMEIPVEDEQLPPERKGKPKVRIYQLQREPLSDDMIKSMTFESWTPDRVGACAGRMGNKCDCLKYVMRPWVSGQKHYIMCLACGAITHL